VLPAHYVPLMRLHVQAMGLATVRHFSRLMPLLLEWIHAPDLNTRLAALQALHTVAARTWPRLPAHASLIWQHVVREFRIEARQSQRAGDTSPSVT
jgi:hypothetical protein